MKNALLELALGIRKETAGQPLQAEDHTGKILFII